MRHISGHYVFNGHEFIKNGVISVCPETGMIFKISTLGEPVTECENVEFFSGIIVPGFVNAHCHLELSHLKGLVPEHLGMAAFCEAVVSNRNCASAENQESAMYEADKFMESEGIVAVGDISNTMSSIEVKRKSRLAYTTFIETFGLNPDSSKTVMNKATGLRRRFLNSGLPAWITPHAPYSMSEELFNASVKQGNAGKIITIHNKESLDEIELFENKCGKMKDLFGNDLDLFLHKYNNPMQRILERVAPKTKLILVHNTYVNRQDLELIDRENTVFVLCPASNLYIENRLPDVNLFVENSLNIAIGTDSLASNKSLSILNELKILSKHFPCLSLQNLLQWATLGGAKALGIDKLTGSFEIFKCPHVLLLSDIDFQNMKLTDKTKVQVLI